MPGLAVVLMHTGTFDPKSHYNLYPMWPAAYFSSSVLGGPFFILFF